MKDRAIILYLIMAVILAIPVYADDQSADGVTACDKAAVQSGLSDTDETESVTDIPDTCYPDESNNIDETDNIAEDTDKDKEEVNEEEQILTGNDTDSSRNDDTSDSSVEEQTNRLSEVHEANEEETIRREDKPDVPLLRPSSWSAVFEAPGY